MPQRIQLSRKNGWRMPPNCVKVDRTTRWGNPWRIITDPETGSIYVKRDCRQKSKYNWAQTPYMAQEKSVKLFYRYARWRSRRDPKWLEPLLGKDLVVGVPGVITATVILCSN